MRAGAAPAVVSAFGLALVGAAAVSAETPVRLDRWTFVHGLPQAGVDTLAETADGYLWVGTRAGLARFDGESFKIYDGSSRPALRSSHIRDLAVGIDETLWIATDGAGLLNRPLGEEPRPVNEPGLADERIFSIGVDGDGLWLGTYNHGLFRLDAQGLRDAPELRGAMVSQVVTCAGADGDSARAWVGTFGRGVFEARTRGDGELEVHAVEGLPDRRVAALLLGPDGLLWIGTVQGLFAARDGILVDGPWAVSTAGRRIFTLTAGGAGDLWIGSRRGLLRLHADGRLDDAAALGGGAAKPADLSALVEALYYDRRGQLWIGAADLHRVVFRPPRYEIPPIPAIEGVWADGEPVDATTGPVGVLRLPGSANRVTVELALPFLAAQPGRPQLEHRLGHGPWRGAGKSRTATFDHFPAGVHVFEVRTVHGGTVGPSRRLELYKAPKLWRRPAAWLGWAVAASLAAFAVHRRRVAQLSRRRELLRQRIDQSLEELKILHGRLPICGTCRKIRRDDGYWSELEDFMAQNSQAILTHGICPECAEEMFGFGADEPSPGPS